RLGEAGLGDLGVGEDDAGDRRPVFASRFTSDHLRRDLAFLRGLVREHWSATDVANRIDARYVGATLVVGRHETAVVTAYAALFESSTFAARPHPGSGEHVVTVDVLGTVRGRYGDRDGAVGVFRQALGLGLREHFPAALGDVAFDQSN